MLLKERRKINRNSEKDRESISKEHTQRRAKE